MATSKQERSLKEHVEHIEQLFFERDMSWAAHEHRPPAGGICLPRAAQLPGSDIPGIPPTGNTYKMFKIIAAMSQYL